MLQWLWEYIAKPHLCKHLEQSAVILSLTRSLLEVISQDLMSSAIFSIYINNVLALLNQYSQRDPKLVDIVVGWDDKT